MTTTAVPRLMKWTMRSWSLSITAQQRTLGHARTGIMVVLVVLVSWFLIFLKGSFFTLARWMLTVPTAFATHPELR